MFTAGTSFVGDNVGDLISTVKSFRFQGLFRNKWTIDRRKLWHHFDRQTGRMDGRKEGRKDGRKERRKECRQANTVRQI